MSWAAWFKSTLNIKVYNSPLLNEPPMLLPVKENTSIYEIKQQVQNTFRVTDPSHFDLFVALDGKNITKLSETDTLADVKRKTNINLENINFLYINGSNLASCNYTNTNQHNNNNIINNNTNPQSTLQSFGSSPPSSGLYPQFNSSSNTFITPPTSPDTTSYTQKAYHFVNGSTLNTQFQKRTTDSPPFARPRQFSNTFYQPLIHSEFTFIKVPSIGDPEFPDCSVPHQYINVKLESKKLAAYDVTLEHDIIHRYTEESKQYEIRAKEREARIENDNRIANELYIERINAEEERERVKQQMAKEAELEAERLRILEEERQEALRIEEERNRQAALELDLVDHLSSLVFDKPKAVSPSPSSLSHPSPSSLNDPEGLLLDLPAPAVRITSPPVPTRVVLPSPTVHVGAYPAVSAPNSNGTVVGNNTSGMGVLTPPPPPHGDIIVSTLLQQGYPRDLIDLALSKCGPSLPQAQAYLNEFMKYVKGGYQRPLIIQALALFGQNQMLCYQFFSAATHIYPDEALFQAMRFYENDIPKAFAFLKNVETLKEMGVSNETAISSLLQNNNDVNASIASVFGE